MKSSRWQRKVAARIVVFFTAASWLLIGAPSGKTQEAGQNGAPRKYTITEYNDFIVASRTKDALARTKSLDSFVEKYPDSPLLRYVYGAYYEAYEQLENPQKVMDYADKRLLAPKVFSYEDSLENNEKTEAIFAWARAYNKLYSGDEQLALRAREIVGTGLTLIASLQNLDHRDERVFNRQRQDAVIYLTVTAVIASFASKDYKATSEALRKLGNLTNYDPAELRPKGVPDSPRF